MASLASLERAIDSDRVDSLLKTMLSSMLTDLQNFQTDVRATGFVPIPLNTWREATAFDVGASAANGGVLASDTTPVLDAINGGTDGCQRIIWASSDVTQIVNSIPLPPDLDTASDIVVHTRIVSGGTTDAVGFEVDTFFNEGDTEVADTSETNQTTTYSEATTTILAADIPTGAQTITIGLTPVAHTTDTMAMTASWLEYTKDTAIGATLSTTS